jgi:hypothetical protein
VMAAFIVESSHFTERSNSKANNLGHLFAHKWLQLKWKYVTSVTKFA